MINRWENPNACKRSGLRGAARRLGLLGLSIVLIGGAVAGCARRDGHLEQLMVPRHYAERHPIVLSREADSMDLSVGLHAGRVTDIERQAIVEFLDRYNRLGDGMLTVLVPRGAMNSTAIAKARNTVLVLLEDLGVPRPLTRVAVYDATDPNAAAPIKLVFDRLRAITGDCGLWPDQLGVELKNRNHWNFGCAYQKNIAAMVDNPQDLARPRAQTPVDVARRMDVIDKYRKGQATGSDRGNDSVTIASSPPPFN